MTLALAVLACGCAVLGLVLIARHAEALAWRRSLVAYRLQPPAGLSADTVAAWLGSLSALTQA